MDVGPCAVSAIQIKPRSVRLIINRPAVSGYNVTSVGAKSGHTQDPFAAILFRNGDCAHRRWKVAARTHSIPDLVEVAPKSSSNSLSVWPSTPAAPRLDLTALSLRTHASLLLFDMKRLVCRDRRHHPVSSCSVNPTHLIRPFCSGPTTGPSALIQVGPCLSRVG